jgi:hypothetical protein
MNRIWNRRPWFLMSAVAAVALIGAACADDNGDGLDPIPTIEPLPQVTGVPLDPTPALGATAEAPTIIGLLGEVVPVGGSDVAGEVILTARGDQTEVYVSLTGLTEGGHANHLHEGSCAAEGGISHPLDELMADADGVATATTVLNVSIEELADGHYFTVHAEDDDTIGAAVGCADFTEQM